MDRVIGMPAFDGICRAKVAARILGDWPEAMAALLADTDGGTAAQFTEACVALAIRLYWEGKAGG